jgi:hypothetical protein
MPVDRVTLVLSVLGVLVALLVRLALRPLQAAPPSPGTVRVAAAAGLIVPVVFALTPPDPISASLAAPGMLAATLSCFLFGALPGVLLVLVLRALDRNALRSSDAALIAAASGGLSGNAALELHCPSTAPLHLVLGHATVGAALVLAVLAMRSFARRA